MDVSPLLSPEVVAELREDLRRDWFITANDEYRLELELIWSPPNPLHPNHEMLELDSVENPKNEAIKYRISIHGRDTYSTTKPQYSTGLSQQPTWSAVMGR